MRSNAFATNKKQEDEVVVVAKLLFHLCICMHAVKYIFFVHSVLISSPSVANTVPSARTLSYWWPIYVTLLLYLLIA